VNSSNRARRLLPAAVLAVVVLSDIFIGRGQQVLSLAVIAPFVAATNLGRRATAAYGLLALVCAALLGAYDHQYTAETTPSQIVRLLGIALGSVLAVAVCTLRLRNETELTRATAQAAANKAVVRMAEVLQRNLLGEPPRVPGLETAVRYLPATRHAQVGGDWYDAFPVGDGATMLIIGDVAGHDAPAVAMMSQTRGMLRAIAQSGARSPAAVLTTLDTTFAKLGLHTLVTAAVATLDVGAGIDGVTMRWSNAGHPPPVLVCGDGAIVLLERTPDRLLGVSPERERHDHQVTLGPGDTVLFYTDGLVEGRGLDLDKGTAQVVGQLRRIGREPLDQLCDALLAGKSGTVEDDVALLAVRIPACCSDD
jgi:serine phosphatase RsbU (regulator of sigma subunit)